MVWAIAFPLLLRHFSCMRCDGERAMALAAHQKLLCIPRPRTKRTAPILFLVTKRRERESRNELNSLKSITSPLRSTKWLVSRHAHQRLNPPWTRRALRLLPFFFSFHTPSSATCDDRGVFLFLLGFFFSSAPISLLCFFFAFVFFFFYTSNLNWVVSDLTIFLLLPDVL